MDRYCTDCFYRNFQENDKQKIWGFCTYDNIAEECRARMNLADPNQEDYLDKTLRIILAENSIPSCQFVQSCFDGKCPFYKELYTKEQKEKQDEKLNIKSSISKKKYLSRANITFKLIPEDNISAANSDEAEKIMYSKAREFIKYVQEKYPDAIMTSCDVMYPSELSDNESII